MTDEQLAELERLEQAATPGPWRVEYDVHGRLRRRETPSGRWEALRVDDMRHAIRARNALPALIAEIRRLRARVTELEESR